MHYIYDLYNLNRKGGKKSSLGPNISVTGGPEKEKKILADKNM